MTVHWKGRCPLVLAEAGVEVADDGLARIPFRRPDWSVHRWRLVTSSGRRWWGLGEGVLVLGLELLPRDPDEAARGVLFVAEGESDALALREHAAGWIGLDGVDRSCWVVGVPGSGMWETTGAAAIVRRFPRVYAAGDGDAGSALQRAGTP